MCASTTTVVGTTAAAIALHLCACLCPLLQNLNPAYPISNAQTSQSSLPSREMVPFALNDYSLHLHRQADKYSLPHWSATTQKRPTLKSHPASTSSYHFFLSSIYYIRSSNETCGDV
jgi:hypothetical protein